MLERTETRFGIKPALLAADSAYGSAESLAWLVKRKEIGHTFRSSTNQIGPTTSSPAPTLPSTPNATVTPARRPKSWSNSDVPTPFPEAASQPRTQDHIAPANRTATPCRLKAQCCPNAVSRKILRDLHEDARDLARALTATPQYVEACRRQKKVEMLFAHLKRILRLTRWRLRGPNGARDEFLLAPTAQTSPCTAPFRWVDDNDNLRTQMPIGAPATPSFTRRRMSSGTGRQKASPTEAVPELEPKTSINLQVGAKPAGARRSA